jgi:hypothetical protein
MGSGWLLGCKIVTGVPDAIPVVVDASQLLRGGLVLVNRH